MELYNNTPLDWNDLTMKEKAAFIRLGVANGYKNIDSIRLVYSDFLKNKFNKGGNKKTNISNLDAVNYAINYFMNKGFTDYQAAGLVGNLLRESLLNPSIVNKYSGAYGIAQWLGPRKEALFKKYGKQPTLNQLLDFVWDELNSTHKSGLKNLLASKNVRDAARNAFGYYEFSVGPEGAIENMNKYGQNGVASINEGIKNAHNIMMSISRDYRINNKYLLLDANIGHYELPMEQPSDGIKVAPISIPTPATPLLNNTTLDSNLKNLKLIIQELNNTLKDESMVLPIEEDKSNLSDLITYVPNKSTEVPMESMISIGTTAMNRLKDLNKYGAKYGVSFFENGGNLFLFGHIYDGTTEPTQLMNEDEDLIYTGLPSLYDFQITALKPTVHWDGFNWIGYNDLGLRVTKGPNFNPLNANIIEDPALFENARLALALKTDINRTHAFAEDIRNFTTDLVMMPTGDIIAEPLGIVGKNVVKTATKPLERYNLADKAIAAGRNIWSRIAEPYYINKIHGKNLLGNWNENVATGVSDDIQQFMMDNVVNRNVRELLNAGKKIYALNYADRALNLMQNAKVGQYSLRDYTKAGWDNVSGLYDGDNFISLNKDLSSVDNTYKHEVHHLLDRHNNLLDSQLELLNKAYDETFENLTFNRGKETLSKEALRDEKLTLNSDARNLIVGKETDFAKQDALIDGTSDEDIFKSIRKSGEYGRKFINYLRRYGNLTPEKALQFREAMKHVGMYATPTILTGASIGISDNTNR